MTEEGFPPINDSNFDDDGNISQDLCSELDHSVNPFEGAPSHSDFKLSQNNQREDEHPAFRVFVQSPFSHSTSSKLCLDSKFLNNSKIKASTELLITHPHYSPSMSPYSRKEQKSSPYKENVKNASNPQAQGQDIEKAALYDETRKFRPKVSNPKQFTGFVSDKKPFSEYTNTTANNCMQDLEFDEDYYTGKFGGKEQIIQRQIERFEHSKKVFEQKILKQQRLNKDKELDGCTFKPNIMKPVQSDDSGCQSMSKKRTLEEFLKSQDQHMKKVAQKIERIRENKETGEQEDVRAPQINKKSSKLIEQKREKQKKILREHSKSVHYDQDIFSRLYRSKSTSKFRLRGLDTAAPSTCDLSYSTSQSSHRPPSHRRQMSSNSFNTDVRSKTRSDSLKIDMISSNLASIHEDANTTKHYLQLYTDALYRKERLERMKNGAQAVSGKPVISESSKVLIKGRLKKDLEDATQRILIDRPSVKMSDGEFYFTYEQLKKIMSDLGFLKQKLQSDEQEKLDLIWATLSKEEEEPFYYSEEESQKRIHFKDLLCFLEGIIGVLEIPQEEKSARLDGDKQATEVEGIGKFVKNSFCLSGKDLRLMKQQFHDLAQNRRNFLFESRSTKPKIEHSFRPSLSEHSKKIVEKDGKRERDCFSRLQKGSYKCRHMKETEDDLNNAMREECTFKPKISKHKKNASLQEEEIWSSLYSQAKISKEEREYRASQRFKERVKEELAECSFHPSIHKKTKSIDNSMTSRSFVSSYEDKVYDDFIQRMAKAREHNEAVKLAKEKGITLDRVLRDSKPFEYPRKKKEMPVFSPLLQFKKDQSEDQQNSESSPNSEESKEEELEAQAEEQQSEKIMYEDSDAAMLAPVTERSEGDVNGNSPEI